MRNAIRLTSSPSLANELGIKGQVSYLAILNHAEVVPLMRDADLVVIPSRHEYPEGFPMTIYEALSSRTPIVASDGPMYANHLRQTRAASIYAAGDAESLGAAIRTLMDHPRLYEELSAASAASRDKLQLPVTWGALVENWLDPSPRARLELAKHSLAQAEV